MRYVQLAQQVRTAGTMNKYVQVAQLEQQQRNIMELVRSGSKLHWMHWMHEFSQTAKNANRALDAGGGL
jgi:hypothetical protein